MTAPIIGITMYGKDKADNYPLPFQYVESVRRAGGIVFLLPPGETRVDLLLAQLDGLILAGGGDIDPAVYAGESHETVYMLDPDRDNMELDLARQVIESDLPTLAICRGLQIVNVALGGTLHPHLPDVFGEQVKHRLPPREPVSHPVSLSPDSQIAGIMQQTECRPMSWHHQGVAEVAEELTVVARAPDGVVEAVELRSHRWLNAVQWHPELTAEKDRSQQRLFDELVRVTRR